MSAERKMEEFFRTIKSGGLERAMHLGGIAIDPKIKALRPQQEEALMWLASRQEPYLFINAPTGAGKTLLLAAYAAAMGQTWTYTVHTKALQDQVQSTLLNIPVMKGRNNYPCLIGKETHFRDITAAEGICVQRDECPHDLRNPVEQLCPYYAARREAFSGKGRIANYALYLSYYPMRSNGATKILLADEAHNAESAVTNAVSVSLNRQTFKRYGVDLPRQRTDSFSTWVEFGQKLVPPNLPDEQVPNLRKIAFQRGIKFLKQLSRDDMGHWLVEDKGDYIEFAPVWGAPFVMSKMFGHEEAPESMDLFSRIEQSTTAVSQAVLTSATLMGADYMAETLGFPEGSWAYLDLPSTFRDENRPINFSPVEGMNAGKLATPEGRAKMQMAMDHLISFYLTRGAKAGVIHAVSNKYRDNILQESMFSGIMTSSPEAHDAALSRGQASVLVAANLTEGWDGYDDRCRFVLFPKVPFPSLGDTRTKVRKSEDPRSYDWLTLVSVVQGAGRGVRHGEDYADTWILDSNWRILSSKRRDWIPISFLTAYHSGVQLP